MADPLDWFVDRLKQLQETDRESASDILDNRNGYGEEMTEQVSILIVDDEQVVRESLASWFTQEGYRVETAAGALEALDKLRDSSFDIGLLDIKMPGMDGIELQQRLKEIDSHLVISIMTAYAAVATAIQALKQGAYDYVTKPIDPDDLSRLIRNAVLQRHLVRDRQRELQVLGIQGRCARGRVEMDDAQDAALGRAIALLVVPACTPAVSTSTPARLGGAAHTLRFYAERVAVGPGFAQAYTGGGARYSLGRSEANCAAGHPVEKETQLSGSASCLFESVTVAIDIEANAQSVPEGGTSDCPSAVVSRASEPPSNRHPAKYAGSARRMRLPDLDRRLVTRVAPDPYVRVDSNDYSLDPRLVGQRVELRVSQREVVAEMHTPSCTFRRGCIPHCLW